ncbi:MAG: hypothetical protein ACREGH_02775 [Minisyncoccia bacterium]
MEAAARRLGGVFLIVPDAGLRSRAKQEFLKLLADTPLEDAASIDDALSRVGELRECNMLIIILDTGLLNGKSDDEVARLTSQIETKAGFPAIKVIAWGPGDPDDLWWSAERVAKKGSAGLAALVEAITSFVPKAYDTAK